MFEWLKGIIRDVRIYLADRDLEKIEKMRIRDKYEEEITRFSIQKYQGKQRVSEAKTNLIKARKEG